MSSKILNGKDLVAPLKAKQARAVRTFSNARHGQSPVLAILFDNDSPVIAKYIDLKKRYGASIGVSVLAKKFVFTPSSSSSSLKEAEAVLKQLAHDALVRGIIIQLPLKNLPLSTLLPLIPATKDVDGLLSSGRPTATARAIDYLLRAHQIDLRAHRLAILGHGRLVGAPLAQLWQKRGLKPTIFHRGSDFTLLKNYDLIVTATGAPKLIQNAMLAKNAIVVDAGTASEGGRLVGDVSETIRQSRPDLTITPKFGGVGPLTVAMLFEDLV